MLRQSILLVSLVLLPACAWVPGFEDPEFSVSPYVAIYNLRGKTRMQSVSPVLTIVNNSDMTLRDFGFGGSETSVGGKAELGDGFSGLTFDYFFYDEIDRSKGTLTADWGDLDQGDMVTASAKLNEFRLTYAARVFSHEFDLRGEPLDFGLGLGATMAHRQFEFEGVQDPDRLRVQKVEAVDRGVVYAFGRARLSWRGATLGADYGFSDDWQFGGDFEGSLQDLEVYLMYDLENPAVTLFGGWRYSELPMSGVEDGLRYEMDLVLEGFQFGFRFVF